MLNSSKILWLAVIGCFLGSSYGGVGAVVGAILGFGGTFVALKLTGDIDKETK